MKNISSIHNCFGCGVCAASCPTQVISIVLNDNGFYESHVIDHNNCKNCGICLDVCAFTHKERALKPDEIQINSWAAWSNDNVVRQKCSSGGIGFEIGKQLIEMGYKAIGCRYKPDKERAEHFIAIAVEDFEQSIGSKYIQSFTEDAFKQIKRNGEKYLVTGTPCQIDSFRLMIRKFHCEENFILLDFFCHCVPSMYAWKSYTKMLEKKIGKVTFASWRNKPTGWHDSWTMFLKGVKGIHTSWMSKGDLFYKLFLGDLILGPQCQKECKYKYDKSSADIRIGDLWGETYKENQKGVSALITFTERGKLIVENLKNVTIIETPFEVVSEGQMKSNAKAKELAPVFLYALKKGMKLDGLLFKCLYNTQRVIGRIHQLLNYFIK